MNKTAYERNLEAIKRYKSFYASQKPGLMVRVVLNGTKMPASAPPLISLTELDWQSEKSCRAYARSNLDRMRAYWELLPNLGDVEIPKIQNLAGTGVIAASYVKDAVINQEAETNYLMAPIKDWQKDLGRIGFDPGNPWFRAQMWMLREYVENWDGSFGIVPFTHFDPLDLCNQWRGNDLFMDYYDHPEYLHELLKCATICILELEDYMRSNFLDGYEFEGCPIGVWTPGTYLSCDAGDMCGPDILAEFAIPYTQRIVQAWGGGYLHHHELGIHQIVNWAKCNGLTLQFLNRDPNTKHLAQDISDEHLKSSLQVAIGFISTYDEFMRSSERWADGKCVVAVCCDNDEQARNVMLMINKSSGSLNP